MKFELTLTTVLVFLVPGTIGLFSVMIFLLGIKAGPWIHSPPDVSAERLLAILGGAFIAGTFIDAFRLMSLDWALKKMNVAPLEKHNDKSYIQKITSQDKLAIFTYLNDRVNEYYRLTGNLCIALIGLSFACIWQRWPCWFCSMLVVTTLLMGISSWRRYQERNIVTNQFTKTD